MGAAEVAAVVVEAAGPVPTTKRPASKPCWKRQVRSQLSVEDAGCRKAHGFLIGCRGWEGRRKVAARDVVDSGEGWAGGLEPVRVEGPAVATDGVRRAHGDWGTTTHEEGLLK